MYHPLMADQGDESESSERSPVHLTRWGRTWCTVFGLVATGAGGVAIFTEDLEAGPVALLAFGFVFLLLAIVGYVPRSAKMGGAELAWSDEVGRIMAKAVDAAPAVVRSEIAEELSASPNIPPSVSRATITGALYEERIARILQSAVDDLENEGIDYDVKAEARLDYIQGALDYILDRTDGGRVVIEVRMSTRTAQGHHLFPNRFSERIAVWFNSVHDLVGVVVITDHINLASKAKMLSMRPDRIQADALQIVEVDTDDDRSRLKDALRVMAKLPIANPGT